MLFSRSSENKLILLISVQSSIVRATLIENSEHTVPNIIFNCSQFVSYKPYTDNSYKIKTTMKAIKDAVTMAENQLQNKKSLEKYHISEIHFALSSPWVISYAKTLDKTFEKPTVVTKKGIMGLVAEERHKYLPEHSENWSIVEEKIFDIRLNGYSIAEWEGKQAKSLDISFALSFVDRHICEKFKDLCRHLTHVKNIHFHSALVLHHIGIQTVFPHRESYTLVHVHGELTDVVVVENRMCVFFGSFNKGINTVVRSLANLLKVTDEIADSFLTLYIAGKLDPAEKDKVSHAIENLSQGWVSEFESLLQISATPINLPPSTIVTSRTHEDFFSKSFMTKYPNALIDTFTYENYANEVIYGPSVEQLRVIGLYAIALNVIG